MQDLLPKAAFVLSVGVLGFAYGFATEAWNLFPRSYVETAWRQARALYRSPSKDFLHRRVYERSGTRTLDSARAQPGLTLVTSWWKEDDWEMKARLIGQGGEVVHEWQVDGEALFPDARRQQPYPHGTHLFRDGDLLMNVEYGGTVRLNACSEVQWRVAAGSHHSIAQTDDGAFWIPGTLPERRRGSSAYPDGYPGLGLVWQDQIMKVTENGDVLKKLNVLDILYKNDLQRYLVKAGKYRGDVVHLNDVEPLPGALADEYPRFDAGDLMVSLREVHLVFVFDPETGEVKWHASDPFHKQHDPDFTGDGWIGVFDNNTDFRGGSLLGGTRIFSLQPHRGNRKVRFSAEHLDRFYTPFAGKWQELENGNLLLTEAFAGRVVEVGPDGHMVWEWIKDTDGRSRVAEVMEGTRYDLAKSDVNEWACSPE